MTEHNAQESAQAQIEAPRRTIDLSLMFFANDTEEAVPSKYDYLMKSVTFADEAGFTAVWFPERHFHRFGGLSPNPALLAAAAAVTTKRVRIRPGVVILPLHDILRVREDWAVIDNLSGGRIDLGFAAGWDADSFCYNPKSYRDRGRLTLDGIKQLQLLWTQETVSRVNGNGETVTLTPFPRPIQQTPSVWLAVAKQPSLFEEAGRRGLNILTALLFQPLETIAENIKLYRNARANANLDPAQGRVTLTVHTFVGPDDKYSVDAASEPLRNYLASSVDLWRKEGVALDRLSQTERESVIEFALQRYIRLSGLIGGADKISDRLATMSAIGVDEVACLIDFGIDRDLVISSLPYLSEAWAQVTNRRCPKTG
jgi:natural product biosynthesis luciferase-like monooxygenase protein